MKSQKPDWHMFRVSAGLLHRYELFQFFVEVLDDDDLRRRASQILKTVLVSSAIRPLIAALHGGVGGLIQDPPQLSIALGQWWLSSTLALSSLPRRAHPRREVFR